MPCDIPRRRVGLRFDHRLHQLFAIVEVAAEKRPAAVARSIQQRVDELLVLVHQLCRLRLTTPSTGSSCVPAHNVARETSLEAASRSTRSAVPASSLPLTIISGRPRTACTPVLTRSTTTIEAAKPSARTSAKYQV